MDGTEPGGGHGNGGWCIIVGTIKRIPDDDGPHFVFDGWQASPSSLASSPMPAFGDASVFDLYFFVDEVAALFQPVCHLPAEFPDRTPEFSLFPAEFRDWKPGPR